MVVDPSAEQITEMTLLAAEAVSQFGIAPKVALLSHSNFGASDTDSARKMRRALAMIRERAPDLEVDGEMHGDAALIEVIRDRAVADCRLRGTANLLVMPSLDAANISFTLLKAASDGLPVGPMLLGMSKPIHVVVPSVTARGIVNLSALAVLQAQDSTASWKRGPTQNQMRGGHRHRRRTEPCCGWSLAGWRSSLSGAGCGRSSAPRSPRSSR